MSYSRTYSLTDLSQPDISFERFRDELAAGHSPAIIEAQQAYDILNARRVSPRGLLAMFRHESAYGLLGICKQYDTKSPGNVRTSSTGKGMSVYPPNRGQFQQFRSWQDGWDDFGYRLISPSYPYAQRGANTIEEIIPIFAPASDNNDTEDYINSVVTAMNGYDVMIPDRLSSMQNIPVVWIPAPLSNYNFGHGPYELIVIHDIEGSADSAVNTFLNPGREASTHIITDPLKNRFVQMVGFNSTAWTAGSNKGNSNGLNIENPGYAGQPFDSRVIEYCGIVVGTFAAYTGIPITKLTKDQANTPGVKGICGHGDLIQHGPVSNWHWDPGPTFPWDSMLTIARNVRDGLGVIPDDSSVFFPETGYGVLGGILADWKAAGGINRIGYPHSWEYDTVESGVVIRRQWFERGCAEWIPNRPNQPDVTWSLLGNAVIDNWPELIKWQTDKLERAAFIPGKSMADAPEPDE
jgi:hypothetical protein